MKIFVTGTRGVPGIPGGVEKHCENLYPRIVELGHEVILSRRAPYTVWSSTQWKGIELVDCYSPRNVGMEAILHTFLSVLEARKRDVDVVHIHAIGPSLITPIARLLGMRVVVTNHGPDYDRQKWGAFARILLKAGEKLGCRYANEVIVISEVIGDIVDKRCDRKAHLIYNGVDILKPSKRTGYIEKIGLKGQRYILAVARFVPEKGLHDLIQAYRKMDTSARMVIAGDSDYEDEYSRSLKELAGIDPRIILTGYITGEELHQVYSHADIFVLPSYHEGLPIAMLEALSYGLLTLASNIPANLEVGLKGDCYFRCGDVEDIKAKIEKAFNEGVAVHDREAAIKMVREKYSWDDIARKTVGVYRSATDGA